jgi:hypothetical protein
VHQDIPANYVRLWPPEVTGAHQLSRGIRPVEAIRINERQFPHAHASQSQGDPAAKPTATDDRDVRRFQPILVVAGHCRLSAEQIGLGNVCGRREPGRNKLKNRLEWFDGSESKA